MYPILRVARPTHNISALLPFYTTGLGFEKLSQFENHAGFDGIMLGHKNAPYHLEFTQERNAAAVDVRRPSKEHLLVLYFPEKDKWVAAVKRMEDAGFASAKSWNPYWDHKGKTFEDEDGYRVVLQCATWKI